MISNVLNTMSFGSSEVAVRINSVDTEKLALEDMNAFMQGPTIPTTLLVPKVEHGRNLEWVSITENLTEALKPAKPVLMATFTGHATIFRHFKPD